VIVTGGELVFFFDEKGARLPRAFTASGSRIRGKCRRGAVRPVDLRLLQDGTGESSASIASQPHVLPACDYGRGCRMVKHIRVSELRRRRMKPFMKKLQEPVVLCWTLLRTASRRVLQHKREAKKWKDFMGGTVAR